MPYFYGKNMVKMREMCNYMHLYHWKNRIYGKNRAFTVYCIQ